MSQCKAGVLLTCPHCNKSQDANVEDYVVTGPYGRLGHPYEDSCEWCNEEFAVTRNADETYTVEKA